MSMDDTDRLDAMNRELESEMRECWRQMQEHRRQVHRNKRRFDSMAIYLVHDHQARADLYRTVLRTLILVRRAGRLAR